MFGEASFCPNFFGWTLRGSLKRFSCLINYLQANVKSSLDSIFAVCQKFLFLTIQNDCKQNSCSLFCLLNYLNRRKSFIHLLFSEQSLLFFFTDVLLKKNNIFWFTLIFHANLKTHFTNDKNKIHDKIWTLICNKILNKTFRNKI